jgi:hypothetical protein
MSQVEDNFQKEINDLNGKMSNPINIEKRDMFVTYGETPKLAIVCYSLDRRERFTLEINY